MTGTQATLSGGSFHEELFESARRLLRAETRKRVEDNGIADTTLDQREEIARTTAEQLRHLEYAGAGNNRAAFAVSDDAPDYDDAVVKVAFRERDREHNRNERSFWRRVEGSDAADLFAPVVGGSGDGAWIVQKAVSAGTSEPAARSLRDELRERDLPVYDVNAENTGRLDGKTVVFDYPWGEAVTE